MYLSTAQNTGKWGINCSPISVTGKRSYCIIYHIDITIVSQVIASYCGNESGVEISLACAEFQP